MRKILTLIALGLAMLGGPALAQVAGNPLYPSVPAATGEPHPEGNEFMRRNHMKMLLHDRDLTMHDGVRPANASLKGCFECHATRDETGQAVSFEDDRHFCRVCHDYVAVKVDCFTCHRSTPEEGADRSQAAIRLKRPDRDELASYLRDIDSAARGTVAQSGPAQALARASARRPVTQPEIQEAMR